MKPLMLAQEQYTDTADERDEHGYGFPSPVTSSILGWRGWV
jgi:hypothetical protein